MKNDVGAIILAAGKGARYGGKKQYLELNGIPLWSHVKTTVTKVVEDSNIVVVGIDFPGGATRTESVRLGLDALESRGLSQVLIVESARPLVNQSQLEELISAPGASKTFVRPLVNTVIMKSKDYLNRDEMLELLTPQCFDFNILKHAFDDGEFIDVTDETRIVYEFHSIKPHFLLGDDNLLKITYPIDLHVMLKMVEEKNDEES